MMPQPVPSMPADAAARRAALAAALLASFLTPFMGSSVNIALPPIGREFSLDAVTLGWVATAYILAAAVLLLPFGRLADIAGRRKIFVAGLGAYAAASLGAALVQNGGQLIGLRLLQGISGAMLFGTGVAILTSVFPPAQRGSVLGWNAAAVYIGLSLGPTAGGLITEAFGWRFIFILNAVLAAAAFLVVSRNLKIDFREAAGESFDLKGAVIYGLALSAVIIGFSEMPDAAGIILVVLGGLGLVTFIVIETRIKHPLLQVDLFRHNPIFVFSNAAALINYSATFATGFLLSLYLQFAKGFSPAEAGLILVAQPVLMALISPFAGRLADRLEPRLIASGGMALSAAGLLMLSVIGRDTSLAYLMAALAVIGAGFGFFSSPNTAAVMGAVERKCYGVAASTLGTMRLVGQMLSLGLAMLLFALIIGRVPISTAVLPEFLTSLRSAFTLFAILSLAGVGASLARGRALGSA